MPTEVATTQPETAAPSAPAATPEKAPGKAPPVSQSSQIHDRSAKLIEKYAARAQIAADKASAEHGTVENRDRLEHGNGEHEHSTASDGTPPPEKPRAKDGKFGKDKTEASAETGEAGAHPKDSAPAEVSAETIDKVQKLVAEGKIEEALRKIGINQDGLTGKQWEAFRKDQTKAKAVIERQRGEVTNAYRTVEQTAAQLQQRYEPFERARAAWEAGNEDEAIHMVFGVDANELNRRQLQKLTTRDPKVAELEARLNREAQARQELEQRQSQQVQWHGAVQRTQQALTSLGDPRVTAALGEDPTFSQAVLSYTLQQANAGRSDITIDEAAHEVLNVVATQYQRMQKIFGASQTAPAVGGGKSANREGPTARVSGAKPKPQLSSRGASEAHAAPQLRGQALMDKYVRQAMAMRANELSDVADE